MTATTTSRRTFLQHAAGAGAFAILGSRAFAVAAVSQPADRWRIGCSTRPWDKYDYPVALEAIAQAGYRYVGLMTAHTPSGRVIHPRSTSLEIAKVRDQLDRNQLRVITVYGGEIPVADSPRAGIDALRHLIKHASAVGSQSLMLGGIAKTDLYDAYYRTVAECCDFAADRHVMLVLKPHGGLNADGPQCRKAIEKVNHRNFRLWYDAGNIYYYSDGKVDPAADAPSVAGLVTGWCIKDYKHPQNVFVNPGDGQVDFPAVLAQLKKGGFTQGPLMVETIAPGHLTEIQENARKARLFVEHLVHTPATATNPA